MDNTSGSGGAISDMCCDTIIERCIFAGNAAQGQDGGGEGGAFVSGAGCDCSATLDCSNSLFWKNTSMGDGGAVCADSCITATITNCTAYGNEAGSSGSVFWARYGVQTTLTNNNFWGNAASSVHVPAEDNTVELTHNNLETQQPGAGNISADPLFVLPDDPDFANVDLRLGDGSTCIDAGDNAAIASGTDLDGNPRIVDGDGSGTDEVDMGAYEAQGD